MANGLITDLIARQTIGQNATRCTRQITGQTSGQTTGQTIGQTVAPTRRACPSLPCIRSITGSRPRLPGPHRHAPYTIRWRGGYMTQNGRL